MAFAIAIYAFIFLLVVLAAKELLPVDEDDLLLHVVLTILAAMLWGVVAGAVLSFVGGRRMKQNSGIITRS